MENVFGLLPNRIAELTRTAGAASPFMERIAGLPTPPSIHLSDQEVRFRSDVSTTPLEPEEWSGFRFEFSRLVDILKQVMDARMSASALTQRFIARNDEVLHGNPVIKGTRIPIYQILDCVADGMLPEDIVREFPSIENAEAVTAAIEYASSLCRLNDD